ncbi:hypothetical protein BGX38DRAFT_616622 [Terfezia claveryi]|nr:hypothetical protein BGX38DRAFT_616622 [Terfezia claveryi]
MYTITFIPCSLICAFLFFCFCFLLPASCTLNFFFFFALKTWKLLFPIGIYQAFFLLPPTHRHNLPNAYPKPKHLLLVSLFTLYKPLTRVLRDQLVPLGRDMTKMLYLP